ncbi:MAG: hypothetical protein KGR22_08160 [Planctomycetes bacterium]|jgi:hypothetical protein|nr:hypothetical protein [Planctomycetota bacterium]
MSAHGHGHGSSPGAPLSPEQAARNRRIIVAIAVVFVLMSVSVFVWGMTIVRASRDKARGTDAALRSVAWAVLCYASGNGGAFPTSDAALAAAPEAGPPSGKPWPSTRDAAMGGLEPVALPEALRTVGITWGATPDVVPNINTKGNPSSKGMVDAVNGWLAEYARDRMRGAPEGSGSK